MTIRLTSNPWNSGELLTSNDLNQTVQSLELDPKTIILADGDNKVAFTITNNDITNNPNSLVINNTSIGNGLYINQDGNGIAAYIDNVGTRAGLKIYQQGSVGPSDEYSALYVVSSSGNANYNFTSTSISNNNNTNIKKQGTGIGIALQVENAGTGNGILIAQTGNGTPLYINSSATTSSNNSTGMTIDLSGTRASNIAGIRIYDPSASLYSAYGGTLMIQGNNVSGTGSLLTLRNDNGNRIVSEIYNIGSGDGQRITQAGNGVGLRVSSSATTGTSYGIELNVSAGARGMQISQSGADAGLLIWKTNIAGGTPLWIINEGTSSGIFLDQNGNNHGLLINTESTTGDSYWKAGGMVLNASALTTGSAMLIYSNSTGSYANALTTGLVSFVNDNPLSTGTVLQIKQDGNGRALNISSVATTQNTMNIYNSAAMTSGDAMVLFGLSNTGSTRPVMWVQNTGIGNGIFLDQNGNGIALNIDSEATTAKVVQIYSPIAQTQDQIFLGFDGLAQYTGINRGYGKLGLQIYRNLASASTSDRLVSFINANAGDDQEVMRIQQDAPATGLFLDQNGDGIALNIDSEGTTTSISALKVEVTGGQRVARFRQNSDSIGVVISKSGIGAGQALYVENNGTGNSIFVDNNGNSVGLLIDSEATTAHVIQLSNEGTGNGIFIDQNGNGTALNVDSEATTAKTINISAINTTNDVLYVQNDGIMVGATLGVMRAIQNNASSTSHNIISFNKGTGNGIFINQDGDGIALNIDSASTVTAPIRVTSLVSDPTGAHIIGDIAVVGGVLKICTVAGTPGTWTVVGTQT